MCLCPCVMVRGGRIVRSDRGGVLVGMGGRKKEEGGCVLFGVVLSLGICPKFTPAPHISASAGVMREGESERHSWA